jgi:hypothetical protein
LDGGGNGMNRLAMIEGLKLSEERIRAVRQELERLQASDDIKQYVKDLDARKVGVSV